MRSLAREVVFKCVFSQLFNRDDEGLFAVLAKELNNDDKLFAKQLFDSINTNFDQYTQIIDDYANGYNYKRIYNTDKCALLIGIAELNSFPETPIPVVIDEAVKLSSTYSTEKSTDFVNGILAKYVKEK